VERHKVLAKHPRRADPEEFKYVLWKDAERALAACTFDTPLASFKHRNLLHASDLLEFFDHVDRCAHFPSYNSNAGTARAELRCLVAKIKKEYVAELVAGLPAGLPQVVLSLFDPDRTIMQWFSRAELLGGAVDIYASADAIDDDDDEEGEEEEEEEEEDGGGGGGVPWRCRMRGSRS
jgi:hypothetical protein